MMLKLQNEARDETRRLQLQLDSMENTYGLNTTETANLSNYNFLRYKNEKFAVYLSMYQDAKKRNESYLLENPKKYANIPTPCTHHFCIQIWPCVCS